MLALVDSGASYNFISKRLVTKLGWKPISGSLMKVRLANGDRMESSGIVSGLIYCGKWQARVRFVVLDLTFDCVLGVPWLTMTNPHLDWVKHMLAV